jgi:hypothetical protein
MVQAAERCVEPTPPVKGRAAVTNALLLGQQLAEGLRVARGLIDRTAAEVPLMIEHLRRWYYSQPPDERDRLLWKRFTDAKQTWIELDHVIRTARAALDSERPSLVEVEAERKALATRPLPATVEEEATETHAEAVRRYQALGLECQRRAAVIADLERLLLAPEQTLSGLSDTTARILEAVVTIDREAFVRRLRESRELEHLRARFERLRTMPNAHEAELNEWSQRAGRQLRVPRVIFPWPPTPAWDMVLGAPVEAPRFLWDDDPNGHGVADQTPA